MDLLLEMVLRWAHILPAIILVGGSLYMRLALLPAANTLEDEPKKQLKAELRAKWAKWVMICAGLLLLSGIANFILYSVKSDYPQKYYHPVFGIKFLLALGVFYIASLLSGRSQNAEKFREKESFWLTVNASLAVLIVLMAGALKVADRVPKEAEQPVESDSSALILPAEQQSS